MWALAMCAVADGALFAALPPLLPGGVLADAAAEAGGGITPKGPNVGLDPGGGFMPRLRNLTGACFCLLGAFFDDDPSDFLPSFLLSIFFEGALAADAAAFFIALAMEAAPGFCFGFGAIFLAETSFISTSCVPFDAAVGNTGEDFLPPAPPAGG